MTPNELTKLGIPKPAHKEAYAVLRERRDDGVPMSMIEVLLRDIVANPDTMASDTYDGATQRLAVKLLAIHDDPYQYREREAPDREKKGSGEEEMSEKTMLRFDLSDHAEIWDGCPRVLVTLAFQEFLAHKDLIETPDGARGEPESHNSSESMSYTTLIHVMRESANALDPLWRQCTAALSVGPIDFARFQFERAHDMKRWERAVDKLCGLLAEKYGYEEFVVEAPASMYDAIVTERLHVDPYEDEDE